MGLEINQDVLGGSMQREETVRSRARWEEKIKTRETVHVLFPEQRG